MLRSPDHLDTPPINITELLVRHDPEWPEFLEMDEQLLSELEEQFLKSETYSSDCELEFFNSELAELARPEYTETNLLELEAVLESKGALSIPIIGGYSVMIDGQEQPVSIVAATEIEDNLGDMSSMLYLRDHVQAASMLMDLHLQDKEHYEEEGEKGHTLLLSALHLMSTASQLDRFDTVIRKKGEAGQSEWPHISIHFNDMEAVGPNGWRNKQDTFQMLAYLTLDAIERNFLDVNELSPSHKQFLGSIVPLLEAIGFPIHENSGSWEEVAAHRTSVMAIETALLSKLRTVSKKDGFEFLENGYNRAKDELGIDESHNFAHSLNTLLQNGLEEIGKRLPFESPDSKYSEEDSVKYRGADAALTYVLMYDLPRLLADKVPIGSTDPKDIMSEQEIEKLVLSQLSTLLDDETNGIRRYEDDSYQRINFHTNSIQHVVQAIKAKVKQDAGNSPEINLDEKQRLRNEFTPPGRTAAWTHPLGQLSAWAAKRSFRELRRNDVEEARSFQQLSTFFLNKQLSTITGDNQWHVTPDEQGRFYVRKVPACRLPECYITFETKEGLQLIVPSPHTPLNWSSATLRHALGLLRTSKIQAKHTLAA